MVLFVEHGLKLGVNSFVFLFDVLTTNIFSGCISDPTQKIQKAVTTLIELKRVLKGRAAIIFQLYLPNVSLSEITDRISRIPLEELSKKYSNLLNLAQNFNSKDQIQSKMNLLEKHGKRYLSLEEIKHAPTFHQKSVNGKLVCYNPWSHISVICIERKFNVCSWKGYGPRHDLDHFTDKDGNIDWLGIMNSRYFLLPRQEFLHNDYSYCLKNCPGNPNCFDYYGK